MIGEGLKNIINSYRFFLEAYYNYGVNFQLDSIFFNERYGYGRGMTIKFDEVFLRLGQHNVNREQLSNIQWRNFIINGEFASRENLNFISQHVINNNMYIKLKQCYQKLKKRTDSYRNLSEPLNLHQFFM